nr:MAG TPA: Baseplate wedge protein [Caudoviricetes sp.]
MAQKIINARAKNKRDTSANWTAADPVLLDGEIIIVDTAEGEVRMKIGDGTKKYSQLPFEDEKLRSLLSDKLDKTATAANSSKLNGQEASYYATDGNTVHKTGDETIAGKKTFTGGIVMKGTPTAPTAAKGTNTTQVATTAFVQNALSGISAKGFEFGTTAPTNTNLLWIDTTNGSILKYYNGSAWTAVNAVFK